MRLSELRQKEVINIFTCNSLGCVCDVDFDDRNGCIRFLIIPGPGRFCGVFGRDTEFFIPWNSIRQIGKDIFPENTKVLPRLEQHLYFKGESYEKVL